MPNNEMMQVKPFFDPTSFTISYVVTDIETDKCAIIDPILDYDATTGRTSEKSADKIIDYIENNNLDCTWIIETHIHADHLTSGRYLADKLEAQVAIGSKINLVQETFQPIFNVEKELNEKGAQFDHFFQDNEEFYIGNLKAKIIHTPGHTPACISIIFDDFCFVGDTLFMPDFGTARCDFPGGNAETLYYSIKKILDLPEETLLYMCHDYGTKERDVTWVSTVKKQKQFNIHLAGKNKADFIKIRTKRDARLAMPKLIIPSIQINIRSGRFPPVEENGLQYIKIPINKL